MNIKKIIRLCCNRDCRHLHGIGVAVVPAGRPRPADCPGIRWIGYACDHSHPAGLNVAHIEVYALEYYPGLRMGVPEIRAHLGDTAEGLGIEIFLWV